MHAEHADGISSERTVGTCARLRVRRGLPGKAYENALIMELPMAGLNVTQQCSVKVQ
jgi:hypothetical protein